MDIDTASFGRLVVLDERSHRIELHSLWQYHPTVIVFVRHFG